MIRWRPFLRVRQEAALRDTNDTRATELQRLALQIQPRTALEKSLSDELTRVTLSKSDPYVLSLYHFLLQDDIFFVQVEVGPSSFLKIKMLGKGDVGRVYLVKEKKTDKLFAMKGRSDPTSSLPVFYRDFSAVKEGDDRAEED